MGRGKRADAKINFSTFEHDVDATVLRQPAFANVHAAHDLDTASDSVQQMLGNFQGFVQSAIDPIADTHAPLGGLNVDVAGALFYRVEYNIIHQTNDWRLAGDLLDVANVLDGLLDQRHIGRVGVFDNVVDHEDFGIGKRRDHPPNVLGTGGDDLHLGIGQSANLVDQEKIRRFRNRDRQYAANQEQRQHKILLDIFARQYVDDLEIKQANIELGIGHPVLVRQALDDLVLGAILEFDEDFAQQLFTPFLFLMLQRRLQITGRDIALVDQQAAEASGSKGGRGHFRG